LIYYEIEADIGNKLNKYLKMTGIINSMFRPQKALQKKIIKLYNTLSLPALLYGGENWNIKARDARRITTGDFVLQPAKRTPPKTSRTKSSNTQRTEYKTTDVVIYQHSRKLLKMDILTSETC